MNKKKVFHNHYPEAYYFDESNLENLPEYLLIKHLVGHDETIGSTEKPGEGNMNFVRRVITDKRSFIIKQCRPWVEKYPQIEAPVERLEVEAAYYKFISQDPFFHPFSPGMIAYDPENLIIVLKDLGKGSDFTFSYQKYREIHDDQLNALLSYVSRLHHSDWGDQKMQFPDNQVLKQLNHEHIFNYPYLPDNGFDLDTVQPGLQVAAMPVKENEPLKQIIRALGQKYLASGPVLIHGDYYPGSWLKVNGEVKVIDPEFAYFGYAEFDIAVFTAHLYMSGMRLEDIRKALEGYQKREDFDYNLFSGFCGTEILRRLIGLAQLPLDLTLKEKTDMIHLATAFIHSPETYNLL